MKLRPTSRLTERRGARRRFCSKARALAALPGVGQLIVGRHSTLHMKSCAYCGKEHQDAASVCADCGTAVFKVATIPAVAQTAAANTERESRTQDLTNDPRRMFRALVLIATGTYLIWFLQLVLGGRLVSPEVWDALSWHGYGAILPIPKGLSCIRLGKPN